MKTHVKIYIKTKTKYILLEILSECNFNDISTFKSSQENFSDHKYAKKLERR